MLRIAHISDLHLSVSKETERGGNFVELLESIRKHSCDHIVITGDIADDAVTEDLVYAREILAQFDFMNYEKLTVIPGNHDIYGASPSGDLSFTFVDLCSKIDIRANEKVFTEVFKEVTGELNGFPFVKLIENVAFICVNSMFEWSIERNPEGSNGSISSHDLKVIDELLASEDVKNRCKIFLMHHHLSRTRDVHDAPAHNLWLKSISYKMDFYKPSRLLKVLKKHKVNLLLHGHTHYTGVYVRKGITCVNSSAASAPLYDGMKRRYSIIDIPDTFDENENIMIQTVDV